MYPQLADSSSVQNSSFVSLKAKISAVVAIMLLINVSIAHATAYFYNGVDNPSSTMSWGTSPDGTGINPPNFTTKGDTFTFSSSQMATLTRKLAAAPVIDEGEISCCELR
jgi:hypothetical protein